MPSSTYKLRTMGVFFRMQVVGAAEALHNAAFPKPPGAQKPAVSVNFEGLEITVRPDVSEQVSPMITHSKSGFSFLFLFLFSG